MPFTSKLFGFSFPKPFAALNFFVALFCEFFVRRCVCAFILSIAVVGLLRHLMNLLRISDLSTLNKFRLIDRRFP